MQSNLLEETASDSYVERTRLNVLQGDGTLVLVRGEPEGGTLKTIRVCEANGKPVLVIDVAGGIPREAIAGWIAQNNIRVLNVAGPRESKQPGIYRIAVSSLEMMLGGPWAE